MGFGSAALSQLMVVPPYAAAGIFLVIAAYTSDRMRTRGLFIVASCTLGGIGYVILLGVTHNQYIRYFATFCVSIGTYASIALVLAWFTHNLGSETKRATGMPLF
ncbi:hypothetical protein ID866_12899, partial [Astraeus odoratus]